MKRAYTACVETERELAPGRLYRADGKPAFATALDDCVVCLASATCFVVGPCGHAVCSACDARLAELARGTGGGDARMCPICRFVAHADEMATLEMPEAKLAEFRELECQVGMLSTATAHGSSLDEAPGGIVLGQATLDDGTRALLLAVPKNMPCASGACRALVVLLDDSGSMLGDWLAMHGALRAALEAMCDDSAYVATYVAFLSFSSGARERVAPCVLVPERIGDILAQLVDCDGGMTHIEVGLKLADETALKMSALLDCDGAHATPSIVVVTDGSPTHPESAALALAATKAPVHVIAYGSEFVFKTCDDMFKYSRRGGTSMLFTRVVEPAALVPALSSHGAHGLQIRGGVGSRCYYNGAVLDFDGTHVVVVDPRHGIRVGFTGPVDVATLSLYGARLDVSPSFRHGMDVRDFMLSTVVTQYAQKLALDCDGHDANAVLLRRAKKLVARVAPTLGAVLEMLDSILGNIAGRCDSASDSCAVARTVSGAVRAYTCPR
jgi:hypothetical protein